MNPAAGAPGAVRLERRGGRYWTNGASTHEGASEQRNVAAGKQLSVQTRPQRAGRSLDLGIASHALTGAVGMIIHNGLDCGDGTNVGCRDPGCPNVGEGDHFGLEGWWDLGTLEVEPCMPPGIRPSFSYHDSTLWAEAWQCLRPFLMAFASPGIQGAGLG